MGCRACPGKVVRSAKVVVVTICTGKPAGGETGRGDVVPRNAELAICTGKPAGGDTGLGDVVPLNVEVDICTDEAAGGDTGLGGDIGRSDASPGGETGRGLDRLLRLSAAAARAVL